MIWAQYEPYRCSWTFYAIVAGVTRGQTLKTVGKPKIISGKIFGSRNRKISEFKHKIQVLQGRVLFDRKRS